MRLIHSSQADTQNISHLHVTFIAATKFAPLLPSMALEDLCFKMPGYPQGIITYHYNVWMRPVKQKQRRARQSVSMVPKKGYNCPITEVSIQRNQITDYVRPRAVVLLSSEPRSAGGKNYVLAASPLAPHACSRSTVIQEKNKRLLAVYDRVKTTGHNIKGNHFETLASGKSVYLWECRPLSPVAKLYSITSSFGI